MSEEQKPIPLEEQETVIQISRDGQIANIWTSDSTMIYKIEKFLSQSNSPYKIKSQCKLEDGRTVVLEVECPKKLVRLMAKQPPKREYTEEEKETLRKRLAAVRKASITSSK